jgi:hypothetical protein
MTPPDARSSEKPVKNPYAWWAGRAWHGMTFGVWRPLLWRHARTIALKNYGLAATVTFASGFNSTLALAQRLFIEGRVAKTKLVDAPIFIVGHWRSGTTLLHELMVLDERFTSPTTYQCMAPDHFLASNWMLPVLPMALPSRRPMDNMAMGFSRPQEDEFALCNMGAPSPYLHCAFPRDRAQLADYLDFATLTPAERERWKQTLLTFLQRITYRTPKRIVLKSPPHLARVGMLLELFPQARFVHIVRDPGEVFSSTAKLWKTLYESHAFETPPVEGMIEQNLAWFERMYRQFEKDRGRLPPHQLCEVRYEDLLGDPLAQMERIYSQLEIGDFAEARPKIAGYFENARDYRRNPHALSAEEREQINQRWGPFMQRFGYCLEPASASTPTS